MIAHTHITAEDFGDSFRFANALSRPLRPYLERAYGLAGQLVCPSEYNQELIESYTNTPTAVYKRLRLQSNGSPTPSSAISLGQPPQRERRGSHWRRSPTSTDHCTNRSSNRTHNQSRINTPTPHENWIFTDSYFPGIDGIMYTIKLWREKLEARGHEVYIIYPDGDYEPGAREIPIRSLPELDLVHCHGPAPASLLGRYYAQRHNLPAIYTHHTPIEAVLRTDRDTRAAVDRFDVRRTMEDLGHIYRRSTNATADPVPAEVGVGSDDMRRT